MPLLLFVGRALKSTPMTDQSPLPTDEEIWDELLNSEASKRFLDKQIKEAEKLLDQENN